MTSYQKYYITSFLHIVKNLDLHLPDILLNTSEFPHDLNRFSSFLLYVKLVKSAGKCIWGCTQEQLFQHACSATANTVLKLDFVLKMFTCIIYFEVWRFNC
jgi:hypothetical protein